MKTRLCRKCLQIKEVTEFYAHKTYGYQTWCKDCKREYKREYDKRPNARAGQKRTYERLRDEGYYRDYQRKQRQDPRLRVIYLARWYANRMLKNGLIERQPCAVCGKDNSQMHHPNYNEPLLIVWLCSDCHAALHRKISRE